MNRREFLTRTASVALAIGAPSRVTGGRSRSDLPRRLLGRTGVEVSTLVFGGGSHFLSRVGGDRAKVETLIHRALELGITSFDTAAAYTFPPHQRLSETYYGEILGPYRKDIFLSTKARERDRDGILRSVETSLRLLRTDRIDLLQMHGLQGLEELDAIGAASGALGALKRLQEQKVIRFVGITGHYDPEVLLEAVRRFDVDTILLSLNAAQAAHPLSMAPDHPLAGFEKDVLPAATSKKMGVVAMKVMGQGTLVGDRARATPQALIRYALSLPVASVEISHTSLSILEQNVAAARSFQPMDEAEMDGQRQLLADAAPRWASFLRHHED
jgi:aryl-alcohol dehydrogenase-like predicted oxidoreductase